MKGEKAAERETAQITLGPVLFNWQPEQWRDFYLRIADEAPVTTVYLGEAVCSKRAPLFYRHYDVVADRLKAAGKTVVMSTLSEVIHKLDRKQVDGVCATTDFLVEANDAAALQLLKGRPHHIGPFVNVYNERTLSVLAEKGATNFCLPVELPGQAVRAMCEGSSELDVTIEVQVFGRLPLALSARCYHARAHGRTRDSCLFVCENDPDGMELKTLDGKPFLTVNGIQTLSYDYLNLAREMAELGAMGVSRFRLSPHSCDMIEVASVFQAVLDQSIDAGEATARLDGLGLPAPFSNGFYHHQPGYRWSGGSATKH